MKKEITKKTEIAKYGTKKHNVSLYRISRAEDTSSLHWRYEVHEYTNAKGTRIYYFADMEDAFYIFGLVHATILSNYL